jgi:hypothetical protein
VAKWLLRVCREVATLWRASTYAGREGKRGEGANDFLPMKREEKWREMGGGGGFGRRSGGGGGPTTEPSHDSAGSSGVRQVISRTGEGDDR